MQSGIILLFLWLPQLDILYIMHRGCWKYLVTSKPFKASRQWFKFELLLTPLRLLPNHSVTFNSLMGILLPHCFPKYLTINNKTIKQALTIGQLKNRHCKERAQRNIWEHSSHTIIKSRNCRCKVLRVFSMYVADTADTYHTSWVSYWILTKTSIHVSPD